MDDSNGISQGQYRTRVSIQQPTDRGIMEMTNLLSNPSHNPDESSVTDEHDPVPGMKRVETAELLNITLHQSARNGDAKSTQILLEHLSGNVRKKVNHKDEDKLTALHYAARYNHKNIAALLLKYGADPNARDSEGLTPLHYSARCKKERTRTKSETLSEDGEVREEPVATESGVKETVVTLLVESRADPNAQDIYGQTPLHYCAMRGNEPVARELMTFPAINIEITDKQGMTVLHMAALYNQCEIARMLIQRGAKLRCQDDENSTPLHSACTEGNVEIVKLLFQAGAKQDGWVTISNMVTDRDCDKNQCLHLAVENDHIEVVKLCLQKRADVNTPADKFNNPLHLAAKAGNENIVRLLVEHRARIDCINEDQQTPLHIACSYNHMDVVKFLVDRGASMEKRDKDNFTPLLMAATYGHAEVITTLLERGADFAAMEKNDKTAIFLCAEEDNLQALKALLSDEQVRELINQADRYDNIPLHIAAEKGYTAIVKCLLNNGADLDYKNEEEQTPLHLAAKNGRTNTVREIVMLDKSTVNDEDEYSNTALHLAAQNGHNKVAQILLDNGADVAARNCNLWTPLDVAASKGWVKTCKILLQEEAPINPMDKTKTTPLHLACRYGHGPVVSLLLQWKANVSQRDSDSKNCLDLAIDNNHPSVVELIIKSEFWEDGLRNETLELGQSMLQTPMRKLIKKMPDMAELVFNRCMVGNKKHTEHPDYKVTFNYEFLDDAYSIRTWKDQGPSDVGSSSDSVYNEDFKLSTSAKPYTTDSHEMKKNHPLMIMVTYKRDYLLAHPLVTSLLRHKWTSFGRTFYYINFLIFAVFLTFLTGYVVSSKPPYTYDKTESSTNITIPSCGDVQNLGSSQPVFAKIGKWVIIALACWNLLREILQIYQAKLQYLGWENLIEWITYVFALILVIDFSDCQKESGYRYDWQWSFGAVAIFLAWIECVLFFQKFPRFGIYVVMFKDILNTFLQFFIVFFLFIVAFSLGFYTLLQNQAPFDSVWESLIKTSVMMIGEFEYDTIFYSGGAGNTHGTQVYLQTATYIMFVVFMILMSIIVMNLLVGLAVDDIKAVQEQAALKRMAMQVELALDVERVVPEFIRRKFVVQKQAIKPNEQSCNPFRKIAYVETGQLTAAIINKALNPELDDIEVVQEQQEALQKDMTKIKGIVKDLSAQNSKIEGMLMALLRSQDVAFTEEDFQDQAFI